MSHEAIIVDEGHGPQVAGTRITVQDVLPYLQAGHAPIEIADAMLLTAEEIAAVQRYIDEHREQVLEDDRRIRERNATRRNPAEVQEILRQARQERQAKMDQRLLRGQEGDGTGHPGGHQHSAPSAASGHADAGGALA